MDQALILEVHQQRHCSSLMTVHQLVNQLTGNSTFNDRGEVIKKNYGGMTLCSALAFY